MKQCFNCLCIMNRFSYSHLIQAYGNHQPTIYTDHKGKNCIRGLYPQSGPRTITLATPSDATGLKLQFGWNLDDFSWDMASPHYMKVLTRQAMTYRTSTMNIHRSLIRIIIIVLTGWKMKHVHLSLVAGNDLPWDKLDSSVQTFWFPETTCSRLHTHEQ